MDTPANGLPAEKVILACLACRGCRWLANWKGEDERRAKTDNSRSWRFRRCMGTREKVHEEPFVLKADTHARELLMAREAQNQLSSFFVSAGGRKQSEEA